MLIFKVLDFNFKALVLRVHSLKSQTVLRNLQPHGLSFAPHYFPSPMPTSSHQTLYLFSNFLCCLINTYA